MTNQKHTKKSKSAEVKKRPAVKRQIISCRSWLGQRARLVSLFGGMLLVVLWTLLRHISSGINFDIVGQLGVAQQWAHGLMSGTQLGVTNYLLKIPLYILINSLHFLTPMNRILLAAVVCNIAAFLLLFILYEKIMNLYQIKYRTWLYIAMLWLATIIGSVFWADYANSRNIEAAGGLLFIYFVLKYLKDHRPATLAVIGVTGGVVFFADPLQLYVAGLGSCLFITVRLSFRPTKPNLIQAAGVLGATAVGYLFARLLSWLVTKYLQVSFLTAQSTPLTANLSDPLAILRGVVTSSLKIFGANFLHRPYGFNSLRELMNALVLAALVVLLVKLVLKSANYLASGLVLTAMATNYLAYIASGQVRQWQTSRYLIMVPLLSIVLLMVNSDRLNGKHKLKLQYSWLAIIALSSLLVTGALVHNWPLRHSKDVHISSLISFMQHHNFKYALSSREAGITTTYFGQGKVAVLPMECGIDHTLQPTNLFYDSAAFKVLASYHHEVPIILQPQAITFSTNVCTRNDIIAQFGSPKHEFMIPGIGSALTYDAQRLTLSPQGHFAKYVRFKEHNTKGYTSSNLAPALQATPLTKLNGCLNGTTDVVVAHTDDDILFMNPDLTKQIITKCVRSIYVTAADDGRSQEYWKHRQRGIEAAYALMLGAPNKWTETKTLVNGHMIQFTSLLGHPTVGLVFLLLPDGGVKGKGFAITQYASLEGLAANSHATAKTVDGSSSYSYDELTRVVSAIISNDQPDTIFTHLSDGPLSIGDHSDHRAVGRLTLKARSLAKSQARVSRYIGYPSNNMPANLSSQATKQKKTIFYTYAYEDSAICSTKNTCAIEATYGKYFSRSYKLNQ